MQAGSHAGRQSCRQAVLQADRPNTVRYEKFLKLSTDHTVGISWILTKEWCDHRVTNVFQLAFSGKVYCEACCGGAKKWDAMFFHVNPYY